MEKHSFESVSLKTDEIGGTRKISTVEDARDFLRGDWPKGYDVSQLTALVSCLEAIVNPLLIAKARLDLIAAAKKADIFISE